MLMALLQASWVHVYLSYPFVLGWSLLEAMACGCCIVGSQGMPVEEAIEHNIEGRLIPMNQPELLVNEVCSCCLIPRDARDLAQRRAVVHCSMTSDSRLLRLLHSSNVRVRLKAEDLS